MALVLGLGLAVGASGCIVHTGSHRRAGKSCGAGKVWVKRGHKWKCKKRHHDRGKHKGHHKGKGKKGKSKKRKRDHR